MLFGRIPSLSDADRTDCEVHDLNLDDFVSPSNEEKDRKKQAVVDLHSLRCAYASTPQLLLYLFASRNVGHSQWSRPWKIPWSRLLCTFKLDHEVVQIKSGPTAIRILRQSAVKNTH